MVVVDDDSVVIADHGVASTEAAWTTIGLVP